MVKSRPAKVRESSVALGSMKPRFEEGISCEKRKNVSCQGVHVSFGSDCCNGEGVGCLPSSGSRISSSRVEMRAFTAIASSRFESRRTWIKSGGTNRGFLISPFDRVRWRDYSFRGGGGRGGRVRWRCERLRASCWSGGCGGCTNNFSPLETRSQFRRHVLLVVFNFSNFSNFVCLLLSLSVLA